MKKTKMLALTLVVAIMLAGAGYAAWTDTIKVNTTLETGEFKVELGMPYARVYILGEEGDAFAKGERIASNPKNTFEDDAFVEPAQPEIEDNELVFEFKNLYPGTRSYTQWYATNTGSITATVEDVKVELESTTGSDNIKTLESQMRVNGIVQRRWQDDEGKYTKWKNLGDIPVGTSLQELKTLLPSILEGQEIKPGEQIFFTGEDATSGEANGGEAAGTWLQFTFPDNNNTNGDLGENEKLEVKITMDFIQYNLSTKNSLDKSGLVR